jgi:hypothetical protein
VVEEVEEVDLDFEMKDVKGEVADHLTIDFGEK